MDTLDKHINSKNNNLNALRLLLAFGVLHSHSYALYSGKPETEPFRSTLGFSLGGACVDCFFFISGLLVTNSLLRRGDAIDFLASRLLRVFPAAIFTAFATVFFIGPIFTDFDWAEYLKAQETYAHLLKNSTIVFGASFDLPGLFRDNPYPAAVNGSLWTLPYEIRLYIATLLTWLLSRLAYKHTAIKVGHLALICATLATGFSIYYTINATPPPPRT